MPAENRRTLTDLRAHTHTEAHAQTQMYTHIHSHSGIHAILSFTQRFTRKGIHAYTHTGADACAHVPLLLCLTNTHGEVYRNECAYPTRKGRFQRKSGTSNKGKLNDTYDSLIVKKNLFYKLIR